jgi:single-strand DNA-binding protein
MNVAVFGGRMTRDAELRTTSTGTSVAGFSLANNSSYKNKDGEWVNNVTYLDFDVWNGSAENLCKVCKKGDYLNVQAEAKTNSWTDKDGMKRSKLTFTVLGWNKLNIAKATGKSEEPDAVAEVVEEVAAPAKEKPKRPKAAKIEDDDSDLSSIPF